MKTAIKVILGIVVLAIVAILVVPGQIIKFGVEKFGSHALGSQVKVGSIDVSYTKGSAEIRDLSVANPEGFKQPHVITIGSVKYQMEPKSVTTDQIVINRIQVDDIAFTYERAGGTDNLKTLQRNLEQNLGMDSSGSTEQAKTASKPADDSGKSVLIEVVEVNNPKLNLAVAGLPMDKATIGLKTVRMTNIGGKDSGTSPVEALSQILKPILAAADLASVSRLRDMGMGAVDSVRDAGKGAIDNVKKGIGGLFGGKK